MKRIGLCVLAVAALSIGTADAQFIGCPDTNPAASASQNTFPMGNNVEWRFQTYYPAACFPSALFKITDMALAKHGGFSTSHPGTYTNFRVRMALSNLAAPSSADLDSNMGPCPITVMNRPNFNWAFADDTWVDFGFDCAFGYDGSSGVIVEISYDGGSSSNIFIRAENPTGGWRIGARGAGARTANVANVGPFSTSLIKPRFTIDRQCVLRATKQVSIGSGGTVQVDQAPSGAPFQIATAFGHATQLNVGSCTICLNPDALFFLSIFGSPLFSGYTGSVPASGTYAGRFRVPNITLLVGLCLSHASVTLNPACCTNTDTTEIVP